MRHASTNTDPPDNEADLSFDDPDLIEKLQQRGTDEEGAMSWEQLRGEIC